MPNRSLGPALRSFCLSLGGVWLSLVRLGAPLGSLGSLGSRFGAPALGRLGDAFGPLRFRTPWTPLGGLGDALGRSWMPGWTLGMRWTRLGRVVGGSRARLGRS